MGYYEFPHTRNYDTDLGYLIKRYFELNKEFDSVKSEFNSLKEWCLAQLNSEALKNLVSNKLDEWLNDGTLEALINNPLNHVTAYDTIVKMLTHSALIEGSKIYCAGADTVNDGKGGHFRIRARLSSDDIDHYNLYLIDGGVKVAERIKETSEDVIVSVKIYGAIGDGLHDDTEALLKCLNENKVIYFPEGIYLTSELTLSNNQKLIGNNATLKAKSGMLNNFMTVANNNEITGITFDLNVENQTKMFSAIIGNNVNNTILNNCIFPGSKFISYRGIGCVHFENSKYITINNCILHDSGDEGVYLVNCNNCCINGGEYYNNPNGSGVATSLGSKHRIINVYCHHNTGSNFSINSPYCVVENCISSNGSSNGFTLGHTDAPASYSVVKGCSLSDNVGGISVQGSSTKVIACNNVINNSSIVNLSTGIAERDGSSNCIFNDNTITNAYYGIMCGNNSIANGNAINKSTFAIYIGGGNESVLDSNKITNCTYGVYIESSSTNRVTVDGNSITKCTQYAIYHAGKTSVIANNVLSESAFGYYSETTGDTKNIINGNQVINNTSRGMYVSGLDYIFNNIVLNNPIAISAGSSVLNNNITE